MRRLLSDERRIINDSVAFLIGGIAALWLPWPAWVLFALGWLLIVIAVVMGVIATLLLQRRSGPSGLARLVYRNNFGERWVLHGASGMQADYYVPAAIVAAIERRGALR